MNALLPVAEPSEVLTLSGEQLARIVDRRALITALAAAMRAYSSPDERALAPLRTVLRLPGDAVRVLATMPGYVAGTTAAGGRKTSAREAGDGAAAEREAADRKVDDREADDREADDREAVGAKLVSVFPANAAIGLESHYGIVALFDPLTGRPRAVLDGTFVTTARTAAVSAVAVEALARPDAAVLAIIGAGVQGRAHLWALAESRPFREVRIASRNADHARALATSAAPLLPFAVRAVGSIEEAVRGADVVVTATAASEPVLQRGWLADGAHVCAVGSSAPAARELDSATVRDALLVVDSRAGALAEAGDLLTPLREGVIEADHIHAELGEVLAGAKAGRSNATQLTLYKSLGLAVQDVAAAALFVRAAEAAGVGGRVRL